MNDDALEKIEIKIAFLERANSELSDVVIHQQRIIDSLQAQLTTLGARIQASQESDVTVTLEDERPPHY